MPVDHDIYMFRNQEVPSWEHFTKGGCWIIKVSGCSCYVFQMESHDVCTQFQVHKNNGVIGRLFEELVCFAVLLISRLHLVHCSVFDFYFSV